MLPFTGPSQPASIVLIYEQCQDIERRMLNMKPLQLILATTLAVATLAATTMQPAKADQATSTRNIILGAAALVAGFAIESNVSHKHRLANTVQGYLPDGSTVYADGHVLLQNGQVYYPGNYGQTIACSNYTCSISGGNGNAPYYGYNGSGPNYGNNGPYYGNTGSNYGYNGAGTYNANGSDSDNRAQNGSDKTNGADKNNRPPTY